MRRRTILATLPKILPAFLLATPAAAPPALHAQESVALRFDWQPGIVAEMSVVTRLPSTTGSAAGMTTGVTQRMRVLPHPEGLLVAWDSGATTMANLPPEAAAMADVVGNLEAFTASILVAPDGAFRGVANLDSVMAAYVRFMDDLQESAGSMQGIAEMLGQRADSATLVAGSRMEWEGLVGRWAGRTLVVGDTIRGPGSMPWPMAEGGILAAEEMVWLGGRVPCREEDGESRCVELHVRTLPDAGALRAFMQASMAERFGGSAPPELLAQLGEMTYEMELETVLVTDPLTLLPHRRQDTHTTRTGMPAMGEAIAQTQVTETTFTYRR